MTTPTESLRMALRVPRQSRSTRAMVVSLLYQAHPAPRSRRDILQRIHATGWALSMQALQRHFKALEAEGMIAPVGKGRAPGGNPGSLATLYTLTPAFLDAAAPELLAL